MTRIRIRRGSTRDAARSNEIDELSFPQSVTALQTGTSWASRTENLFVLAEVGGKIAGYALGYENGQAFQLDTLAVDPEYRRLGVATRLAKAIESAASLRGLGIVVIETSATAEALFRSLGYEFIGEGKVLLWNSETSSRGTFGQATGRPCVMAGSDDFPLVAYLPLASVMAANPRPADLTIGPDGSASIHRPNTA